MIRERNTPEEFLDDEYAALRLLSDRSYRHGAYLCLQYRHHRDLYKGPRIVVQHLGGYADMEVRSEHVTYLTERVVSLLSANGWIRGTPRWGYTDQYEQTLTDYGERWYVDVGRQVGDGIEALLRLYGGTDERTRT